MAEIKIKYQELQDYLFVFEKRIGALEDLELQCSNAVYTLSETWTGDSCNAYVQTMQNYTEQMKQLRNALWDTKRRLEAVKVILESADNEYGDMLSSL